MYHFKFAPYNVLLGIATNIRVLLMTVSFEVQGHICQNIFLYACSSIYIRGNVQSANDFMSCPL